MEKQSRGIELGACMLSCVWLFLTLWTVDHQAPLSMEFSRQEYWSGLPFHTPGYLTDPGIELASLVSPALADGFFTTSPNSVSVQFSCSVIPTLCEPMDCSTPGLPVHHQLPEFTQIQCPSSQWCHQTISSSVIPFSYHLQSFPASGSFPVS